jgi:hypothetical protein
MESIRNPERPSGEGAPAFWLSSRELTAWARPRACHVADAVEGAGDVEFFLVRLDPPGPTGEHALVGPRFHGDRLEPVSHWPLVVNIFAAPDGGRMPPGARPVGVGEIYRTEADAAAADIRFAAARGDGPK